MFNPEGEIMEHNQNTNTQKKKLILLDIGQKSSFCDIVEGRPFSSKWFQWAFRYVELLNGDEVFLLTANGLLRPEEVRADLPESAWVAPQNTKEWSQNIMTELSSFVRDCDITLLSRSRWHKRLITALGPELINPLESIPLRQHIDCLRVLVREIEKKIPVADFSAPCFWVMSNTLQKHDADSVDDVPTKEWKKMSDKIERYLLWNQRMRRGWKEIQPPETFPDDLRNWAQITLQNNDRCIELKPYDKKTLKKALKPYETFYKYFAYDYDEELEYLIISFVFVSRFRYGNLFVNGCSDGWQCQGFESTERFLSALPRQRSRF